MKQWGHQVRFCGQEGDALQRQQNAPVSEQDFPSCPTTVLSTEKIALNVPLLSFVAPQILK